MNTWTHWGLQESFFFLALLNSNVDMTFDYLKIKLASVLNWLKLVVRGVLLLFALRSLPFCSVNQLELVSELPILISSVYGVKTIRFVYHRENNFYFGIQILGANGKHKTTISSPNNTLWPTCWQHDRHAYITDKNYSQYSRNFVLINRIYTSG